MLTYVSISCFSQFVHNESYALSFMAVAVSKSSWSAWYSASTTFSSSSRTLILDLTSWRSFFTPSRPSPMIWRRSYNQNAMLVFIYSWGKCTVKCEVAAQNTYFDLILYGVSLNHSILQFSSLSSIGRDLWSGFFKILDFFDQPLLLVEGYALMSYAVFQSLDLRRINGEKTHI
jgi:hypothetical protein